MGVLNYVGLAVVGLAVLADSQPTPQGKRFSVTQVASARHQPRKGAAGSTRALRNSGKPRPWSMPGGSTNGSAPTFPEAGDVEYLTPVTVGGKTFHVDIDTGSSDFWLFSDETPLGESNGHDIYTPGAGAQKLDGYTFNVSYVDGSGTTGDVFLDTAAFAGVTATRQAIGAVQSADASLAADKPNDGLVGFAFDVGNTITPVPQKTFFSNVRDELDAPLFAVTLKHEAPGTYDFGYIDHAKYTGDLAWTPVDPSQGFWTFTASGYRIGSSKVVEQAVTGIADTGTTQLLLQNHIVKEYYAHVHGARFSEVDQSYTYPCSVDLPPFTTVISGHAATVEGKHLRYSTATAAGRCIGGIQNVNDVSAIFGDVFLKSQYVVFESDPNKDSPRLGFAAQSTRAHSSS